MLAQCRIGERVVQHDVGRCQVAQAAHGDQVGGTRSCADEHHVAAS
jgi:hypothetical protein